MNVCNFFKDFLLLRKIKIGMYYEVLVARGKKKNKKHEFLFDLYPAMFMCFIDEENNIFNVDLQSQV